MTRSGTRLRAFPAEINEVTAIECPSGSIVSIAANLVCVPRILGLGWVLLTRPCLPSPATLSISDITMMFHDAKSASLAGSEILLEQYLVEM